MTQTVTHTLTTGMTIVVEPMPNVRSAALAWFVPSGFGIDEPGFDGCAEVTSELLLRGAGDLDSRAQADAFDRLGASRSAEAGTRYMRFGSTCLGSALPEVFGMLAQTVLEPRFDPDSIEPSKELALQGLDSLADDPGRRAGLAARARHHADPYARSGMGTREGIASLTREHIAGWWSTNARPKGSILAIAGDVDPAAMLAMIDKRLGAWSGVPAEMRVGETAPRGYAHESDDSAQVQIILLHDAPPESHDDAPLERIVIGVLSGGMSARLFTEVREKRGLCYAVHAGYRGERDFGTVVAEVGTTPERAQESLDVLVAELQRIHESGITPEEFERARTRIKSSLVFAGESTGARAGALAMDVHKLGRPRTLDEIGAVYDALALDRVNGYLRRRSLGKVTIQSLGPAELTPPSGLGM